MNYNLTCPNCHKKVKVSTHEAVKYLTPEGIILLDFDCPECSEGIEAEFKHKRLIQNLPIT